MYRCVFSTLHIYTFFLRYYIYNLPKGRNGVWTGNEYYFLSDQMQNFRPSTMATTLSTKRNPLAKTLAPIYRQRGQVTFVSRVSWYYYAAWPLSSSHIKSPNDITQIKFKQTLLKCKVGYGKWLSLYCFLQIDFIMYSDQPPNASNNCVDCGHEKGTAPPFQCNAWD